MREDSANPRKVDIGILFDDFVIASFEDGIEYYPGAAALKFEK